MENDRTTHKKDAKSMRMKEEDWLRQKRMLEEQVQRLRQEAATRAVHNHSSSKDDSEYQHMRVSLILLSFCLRMDTEGLPTSRCSCARRASRISGL